MSSALPTKYNFAAHTSMTPLEAKSFMINATVFVVPLDTPCEFALIIDDLQTVENGEKLRELVRQLPLRFARYGPSEIGEICPDENESIFALNFKRAILSSMHAEQTNGTESVQYEVRDDKCR